MPEINTYQQQYLPQGTYNAQSTPEQMGAGIGQAISDVANTLQQAETQNELTDLYVDMSDARRQFTTEMDERFRMAVPGDRTVVDNFSQFIDQSFSKLSAKYTTAGARREFARMSAAIKTDFLSSAIREQGQLAAQGIKAAQDRIITNNGSVLFNRPEMLESVLTQTLSQIDNPESIYRFLNKPEKDALKLDVETKLREAALSGEIERDPEGFLAKVSPEALSKFSAVSRTMGSLNTREPTVNAKVTALAPIVKENATKYGLDANIMLAQIMQESGGSTAAVSKKGAKGVSQFMPETAAQYGVDVTDDRSSINGQARYMQYLLKLFGGDYQKALAGYNWGEGNLQNAIKKYGAMWLNYAPKETQQYVAEILTNAGASAVSGEPLVFDSEPVKIGDKNFDALPWQSQYNLANRAQQRLEANRADQQRAIADAERERKRDEDNEMTDMLRRLEEDKLTADDVLKSEVLDASSRMVMLNAIRAKAGRLDDTQPKVLNQVLDDISKGKITDPQSLWQYVGKGLSFNDIQRTQALVNGKGTPLIKAKQSFLEAAKSQISGTNPMMGIADPEGDTMFYLFYDELERTIQEKQKEGVSLSKLLDPRPGNKEYVGYIIQKYVRSPQERVRAAGDLIKKSAGTQPAGPTNVPARKDGESIDDYLKRTGGGR